MAAVALATCGSTPSSNIRGLGAVFEIYLASRPLDDATSDTEEASEDTSQTAQQGIPPFSCESLHFRGFSFLSFLLLLLFNTCPKIN